MPSKIEKSVLWAIEQMSQQKDADGSCNLAFAGASHGDDYAGKSSSENPRKNHLADILSTLQKQPDHLREALIAAAGRITAMRAAWIFESVLDECAGFINAADWPAPNNMTFLDYVRSKGKNLEGTDEQNHRTLIHSISGRAIRPSISKESAQNSDHPFKGIKLSQEQKDDIDKAVKARNYGRISNIVRGLYGLPTDSGNNYIIDNARPRHEILCEISEAILKHSSSSIGPFFQSLYLNLQNVPCMPNLPTYDGIGLLGRARRQNLVHLVEALERLDARVLPIPLRSYAAQKAFFQWKCQSEIDRADNCLNELLSNAQAGHLEFKDLENVIVAIACTALLKGDINAAENSLLFVHWVENADPMDLFVTDLCTLGQIARDHEYYEFVAWLQSFIEDCQRSFEQKPDDISDIPGGLDLDEFS